MFIRRFATCVLTIILMAPILCSCSTPIITTTTKTTVAMTPRTNNYFLNVYLDKMRDEGKNEIADKLITLYKTEPDIAYSFGVLESFNPGMVDVVMEQPWYSDGLSEEERVFLSYGFNDKYDGIARYKTEMLLPVIVNRQFLVDTVQLQAGSKYIVGIATDNTNILKSYVDDAKTAFPFVEAKFGIPFPKAAILLEVTKLDIGGAAANGSIEINDKLYEAERLHVLAHEFAHLMEGSHPDTIHRLAGMCFSEGLCDLIGDLTMEEFDRIPNGCTINDLYNNTLKKVKENGWWDIPLTDPNFADDSDRIYEMEFLFMKDLYDTVGKEVFTRMLVSTYKYKVENYQEIYEPSKHPTDFIVESKLEELVLSSCPNDEVKSKVKKLFDERVWGK
jgi:hypothetical protein